MGHEERMYWDKSYFLWVSTTNFVNWEILMKASGDIVGFILRKVDKAFGG